MSKVCPLTRENIHLLNDIDHESITALGALTQLIQCVKRHHDRRIELWYGSSLEAVERFFEQDPVLMRPLSGDDYQVFGVDDESANATLYLIVPMARRLYRAVG